MKYLIFFSFIVFSFIHSQSEIKLNGKYQMKFEEKYSSQNCVITFQDSIYKRKLPSGKTTKGHILYKKFSVCLSEDELNLEMDFAKGEIQKDTIFFSTKNKSDKLDNGLIINEGKLIKLK